jgi:hypothetical protein
MHQLASELILFYQRLCYATLEQYLMQAFEIDCLLHDINNRWVCIISPTRFSWSHCIFAITPYLVRSVSCDVLRILQSSYLFFAIFYALRLSSISNILSDKIQNRFIQPYGHIWRTIAIVVIIEVGFVDPTSSEFVFITKS